MSFEILSSQTEIYLPVGRVVHAVMALPASRQNVLLNSLAAVRSRYVMAFGGGVRASAEDTTILIALPYRLLDL